MNPDELPDDDPIATFKKLKAQQSAATQPDPIAQFRALQAKSKRRTLGQTDSGILRAPAESTGMGSRTVTGAPVDFTQRPVAAESTGLRPFTYNGEGKGLSRGTSGDFEAVGPAIAANVLSAAQAVPGMEAFEAGAGALGSTLTSHPLSYRESLDALRSQTDAIPTPIKVAGRLVGGAPLAAISASPVATGAALGAASPLLDADPDRGAGSRASGAVFGGTMGALIGGAADAAVTKARSAAAPASARVIRDLKNEREQVSGPMFASALTQGKGLTSVDPDVAMFVAQPKVKEIIDGLKDLKKFQGVAEDSPEMLDGVYKVLSDRAAQVKRGLDAVTPNKPNLGRFTARDIRATKDDALTAMDASMPDYKSAVQSYADYSGRIGAVRRGQDAVRGAASKAVTTGKNLDRTTPTAFAEWAATAPPEQAAAAEQGILGATKQATKLSSPFKAIHTLAKTPQLLRATNTPTQRAIDALIRAGLISANSISH